MTEAPVQSTRILVVDDDPRIRQMLTRYFEQEGCTIYAVGDGAAMRASLRADPVDIVFLDVVLPGEDGIALARELRTTSDVGIIMLTGRDDVVDRIVGLEVGADDYVPKPFHLREVLARMKSVLRRRHSAADPDTRPEPPNTNEIAFDGWRLHLGRRQLVSPDGNDVQLTTGEFDLLATLARQPGHVFGRETLMDLTRGRTLEAFDRVIDAQIARLRKKIESNPRNPALIKSVRGVGYVFTGKVER